MGSDYSYCEFEIVPTSKLRILDFSLKTYKNQYINDYIEDYRQNKFDEVQQMVLNNENDDMGVLKKNIEEMTKDFKADLSIKVAKEFFNYIIEVVFRPLDDKEDSDEKLKEVAYGSFHKLALWLEERFDGIVYPSTRMKLADDNGECCVLFKDGLLKYRDGTLRHEKSDI